MNKLCAAANCESSGKMKLATRLLANRKTERRLHAYFSRSLPKVSSIKLPLLVNRKKKLVRQVSCRAVDASSHTIHFSSVTGAVVDRTYILCNSMLARSLLT